MRGQIEAELRRSYDRIAGVDEVGRGCLAGAVYAAAVILNYERVDRIERARLAYLRDSKSLSSSQRQSMLVVINEVSVASALGRAEVGEIEERGIVAAIFLAMHRALDGLGVAVDYLLIDGNAILPKYRGEQRAVVKGDSLCYAIAAASIIAKEARDLYMRQMSEEYPLYGFSHHVGYGTRFHLAAIGRHGPCPLHRRNFAPISGLLNATLLRSSWPSS